MFGVLIYEVSDRSAKIAISKAKEIDGLDKVEVEEEEIESE